MYQHKTTLETYVLQKIENAIYILKKVGEKKFRHVTAEQLRENFIYKPIKKK